MDDPLWRRNSAPLLQRLVGRHRLPAFPEEEWGEDRTLQGSREGYATFAMTVTQPRGIFARYLAVGVDRGEGG